jgi:hypothetical protein
VDDAALAVVYHGMTESYYKALLHLRNPGDVRRLHAVLVESEDVLEVEGVTVVVKVGVTVLVMEGHVDVVISGEGVGERESNTVVVGKEVEVSVVEPESDTEGDRVGDKDTVPVDVPVVDSVGE